MWFIVALLTLGCPVLQPPVDGPVVLAFAPAGRYGGHWGVDFGASPGMPVRAAGAGRVTFAGSVAGMLTVTIDHGRGLKSSTSFLATIDVEAGDRVAAGSRVGTAGPAHRGSVHLSVRVGGRYVDPVPWLRCYRSITRALWLVPSVPRTVAPYASRRAPGHPRRDLRSATSRPSRGG